ncbi:hypothetical protein PHMEG_00040876, partial [Phytophthora megakarya]
MVKGKKLSDGERTMIVNAYKFFLKSRTEGNGATGRTRKLVKECLGTPESTVGRVWKAYNDHQDPGTAEYFTIMKQQEERRDRPQIYEVEDVAPTIASRAMSRLLRRLGYRYIKGENRHYLADSVQHVAFRATYLQRKIANRDKNNNPIRPEVYLDESSVNVNDVRGTTWLSGDRKRYAA